MDRLLIKLVAFILFLFSALAFATEGKSLKLYRNTEVVKKEIIHVHNAFVESITEGEIPDTFRFNDIEIKNITEFTWEITNNTPISSKYFPVKLQKSDGLELVVSNVEVPAFGSAIVIFDRAISDAMEVAYQGNLFLPRVILGPYNVEDCNSPQDLSKTCYSFPEPEQKEFIKNMIALIHQLSNTRQYSEQIEQFMINRCTGQPSRCSNYNDNQLPYGLRNLLAFGGQDHNLKLKVMRNRYRSEGVGGGSNVMLNQYLTNTGGWAATWHSILNPSNVYSERFYRTWFHEIAHAHGFSHASGMTYGFADYFAENIVPQLTTEEERETIKPYNLPNVILDYSVVFGVDEKSSKILLQFLGNERNQSEIDFQVITACEWEKEIENNQGEISIKYSSLPSCPIFIRASELGSDNFSTVKIPRSQLSKSPSYAIGEKKFTLLNSELLNSKDNGWAIRDKCRLPKTHLATKNEYEVLWHYLKNEGLLESLERKYFLSSDGPRSYYIWQLKFLSTEMDKHKYRMQNHMGSKHGLVCVTQV
ncbi:hypothetical protein HB763_18170 [Vibrio campbellii]|uniref:hypothetical protein n=1 Tax=Vibrio campbellii TaxID=680 RepID=UPI00210C2DC4|nr:hypothetical protein [Vibrio campbellii]UTZ38562.1 hypothetical protein HB763_18170 [Vibrio campbellii]